MTTKKHIFIIVGSASAQSSNQKLARYLQQQHTSAELEFSILEQLSVLPHFNPELSVCNTPLSVLNFREQVKNANGIIITTPEYIFSIPSGLKNALEWCVASTVFAQKPTAIITASASGIKGHEELKLIMKTIEAHFTDDTTLLVQGVKGKIDEDGIIQDAGLVTSLGKLMDVFTKLL